MPRIPLNNYIVFAVVVAVGVVVAASSFPFPDQQLALTAPPTFPYSNRIILIRHAEKPGRGGYGLNEIGKQRAQCLRSVFGQETQQQQSSSGFDVGLIFAAPRDDAWKNQERTYMTVEPLAKDLGLDIEIGCANASPDCIARKIEEFAKTSDKDILICWKHRDLISIARALGSHATQGYPGDRNDIMWIMKNHEIVEKRSQQCPTLDDDRKGVDYDKDLVVAIL